MRGRSDLEKLRILTETKETMENLEIYEKCRQVPQNACKQIQEGKLKGKTDINPMWRIQKLTEIFGPCGFGWFITDVEHWLEKSEVTYRDNTTNTEITAYVQLALVVKMNDKWSEKIIGIGGSKLVGKGQGDQANDECFKMAYTDAISVACKMLGMGADIYWSADATKYTQGSTAPVVAQPPVQQPAPAPQSDNNSEADIQMSLQLIAAVNDCNSLEELQKLRDRQLEPLKSSKKFAMLLNARYNSIKKVG